MMAEVNARRWGVRSGGEAVLGADGIAQDLQAVGALLRIHSRAHIAKADKTEATRAAAEIEGHSAV